MREPGHTRGTSRDVPPVLDPASEDCRAISAVLVRVGDKWTVLVVALLGDGPRRFSALKRQVGGISQRMLTLTLRNLERDGLVIRTVTPASPPRVDYALTPLGHSLWQPVRHLSDWARAHSAEIATARRAFDDRHDPTVTVQPGAGG